MRFFLPLTLALSLLLAGCGTQTPPPPEAPAPAEEPAPIPEPLPEPQPVSEPAPEPGDLVLVKDYISNIRVDLKYAGENNFTGQTIYDFTEAYLRYGTVQKLSLIHI